jgi:hypothetical protein
MAGFALTIAAAPLLPTSRKQQHYSSVQQHSFEGPDVITLLASTLQFLYKASMSSVGYLLYDQ